MQDELLLVMLKQDLEILHSKNEEYLTTLINQAKKMIEREGIVLSTEEVAYEDAGLVVMYAAWMYRKRASAESSMPRMLRSALNNKLFSQKAGVASV